MEKILTGLELKNESYHNRVQVAEALSVANPIGYLTETNQSVIATLDNNGNFISVKLATK